MDPTTQIAFGSAIKALEDTGDTMKIGGHLVLFGGPDSHDSTKQRDYFTKSTDFDLQGGTGESTVYYHHGLNKALKARPLGRAKLSVDDAGVWMEAEIEARDKYELKIMEMVRKGKLGLSSGTALHLIEKSTKANGSHEITRWPLGLDASLTPTPAEPRAMALAIKSLEEVSEWGDELKEENAFKAVYLGDYLEREMTMESLRILNSALMYRVVSSALDPDTYPLGGPFSQFVTMPAAERLETVKAAFDEYRMIALELIEKAMLAKPEVAAKSLREAFEPIKTGQLDGLTLDEHPIKLLAAVGDYLGRVENLVETRKAERGSDYVLTDTRKSQLTAFKADLMAECERADALVDAQSADDAAKSLEFERETALLEMELAGLNLL